MSTSFDDDSAGPPPPPPTRAPPSPRGSVSEPQEHAPIDEGDEENGDEEHVKDTSYFSSPPPPPPEPMGQEEIEVPMDNDGNGSDVSTEKSGDEKNKKCIYGSIIACVLVLLAIILGVGYGTGAFGNKGGGGEPVPAPAPGGTEPPGPPDSTPVDETSTERVGAYNEYLASVSNDPDALQDPTAPEWTTVRFMANNDPAGLDPTDTSPDNLARINQRYALLLLYFGSSEDSWTNQENWLNADECTWYGVTCGVSVEGDTTEGEARRSLQLETTVTTVDLVKNGLLGRFPPDLALLSELVTLKLSENGLSGPLPASLSSMVALNELELGDNDFAGALADTDFAPLTNLSRLDLKGNGFTGAIPDSLYTLSNLRAVVLDNNVLTGAISADVSNMASLVRFTVGDNALTGGVPVELAGLANLGTFVRGLYCVWLIVYEVCESNITHLHSLEILWLYNNELTGELSTDFGSSRKLGMLDMSFYSHKSRLYLILIACVRCSCLGCLWKCHDWSHSDGTRKCRWFE